MSTLLPFERVKHIRNTLKDTVFGYIRESQSILPSNKSYYQIPELVQHTILLFYYQQIESSILDNIEKDKLLSLFDEQNKFEEVGNSYSYQMIYSSVEHGDGEKTFKSLCHNKRNLLCLIHSKDNNVFGGYTSSGWTDDVNNYSHGLYDDKSFVFSIRSNKGYDPAIFNVIQSENSLWNQQSYYMMFAGLQVIYINTSGKSGYAASQPQRYQKYPYDSYLAKKNFTVSAIEVFQLQQ